MLKLAIPVLHVSSSVVGEDFYCSRLGFELEFAYRPAEAGDPGYLGLRRDDAHLHLSSFAGDGVAGSLAYVLVDDVDALHRELLQTGVRIDMPPTNQSWGNREMYVRDPDGNKLAFVRPNGS
jgi:uncharacterized glyoxalase superfamily protein PhnB